MGREDELAVLASAATEAAEGGGRIVVVQGEAGIGKTRVLREVLSHAERLGLQVRSGAADEMDARRPFGLIADCLDITRPSADSRQPGIAALLFGPPAEAGPDPGVPVPEVQFKLTEGILDHVEHLCSQGPLVLALDDLQWADPETLLVLHRLARDADHLPLLVVALLRPLPRGPELDALLRALDARGATSVDLRPLDEQAVVALAASVVGARPGPNLRQQLAGAGGNPLFVTELIATLADRGAINRPPDGTAEVSPAGAIPSLPVAVLHRLAVLPPDMMETLKVAAVVGGAFPVGELALVLGRPVPDVVPVLRAALVAGVLEERGERLAFRHDVLRETLYADISLPLRAALHDEAARRLAESGARASRVAEHLLRGSRRADPEALAWLERAAEEAAPRSPVVAANLLAHALELAGPSHPGRDRLFAMRATALLWAGRFHEAKAVCREVLGRRPAPSVEAVLRICLTQVLLAEARLSEVVAEAEAGRRSLSVRPTEQARLQAWGAWARAFLGEFDQATAAANDALFAAREAGDPLGQCLALCVVSIPPWLRGDPLRSLHSLDEGVRLADATPQREGHRLLLHFFRGLCLADVDRLDEGIEAVRLGRRLAEETGAPWLLPIHGFAVAGLEALAGAWDDAWVEITVALELAEQTGARWLVVGNAVRAWLALGRAELGEAEAALAAGERDLAESGPQFGVDRLMLVRARLLEARGAVEQAHAVMRGAWALCASMGLEGEYVWLGPDLVRLALAAGDRGSAEEAAAALAAFADRRGVDGVRGAALLARGLLEDDPGILLQAVEAYRRTPRLPERAAACEDAAVALGSRERGSEARALFGEALGLYESFGAAHDLARAEAAMRRLGMRRGPRGARRRPKAGWESLTASETKVVELVAEGLSNPEIAQRLYLSRPTVKTHVSHVLVKLGLRSRTELAAEATRRRT